MKSEIKQNEVIYMALKLSYRHHTLIEFLLERTT